jgi:hypothetical protein
MIAAVALLADLNSRGIELETDGKRLRWRPAFLVSEELAKHIRTQRQELIQVLRDPVYPEQCVICGWPMDSVRRCPKCFDRLCVDCGRNTGSYFVQRCLVCGFALREQSN